MKMNNSVGISSVALMAAWLVTPAAAQVPGTYSGTSADGQGMSFVVSTDPATGSLAVTAATIFFSAPCKDSTYVLSTGWGIGLMNDIQKGVVTISDEDNYFHFGISLTFASDGQSVTGTITSIGATLYPVSARPKNALICTSPKQALSLSLQADLPASSYPPKGNQELYMPTTNTRSAVSVEGNN